MTELEGDAKILVVWKMAALLQLVLGELRELDEIEEDYEVLKLKLVMCATNRMEKTGGAVPKEIGEARAEEEDDRYGGQGLDPWRGWMRWLWGFRELLHRCSLW